MIKKTKKIGYYGADDKADRKERGSGQQGMQGLMTQTKGNAGADDREQVGGRGIERAYIVGGPPW